jgi:Rieske Fe-S protein
MAFDVNPAETGQQPDDSRRKFLILVPLGILGGIAATMLTAAIRFLRPRSLSSTVAWSDVGPVDSFQGEKPLLKRILAEHQAGWSTSLEEHFVYVLPEKQTVVVSSVCPHEGCNVAWNDGASGFVCPCHDSLFASDGSRLKGPARRGLDPLPSREENGILQVQYLSFVNNTADREIRE